MKTILVPDGIHWALKRASVDAGITMQDLMVEVIERGLSAQPQAVADLVAAAQSAIDQIIEMEPHWEPNNECPVLRQLRAALAKFEASNE